MNYLLSIIIYLAIFYFIPLIYIIIYGDNLKDWVVEINYFNIVLTLIILLTITYSLLNKYTIKIYSFNRSVFNISKFLVLPFFLISFYFFLNYDIDFRYSGNKISSSFFFIIILTFRAFYKYVILLIICKQIKINRLFCLLIALSFLFTTTSTFELSVFLFFFTFLFFNSYLTSNKNLFLKTFIFLFIISGVVLFGFINKLGYDKANTVFDVYGNLIFQIVIERFSTYIIAPINYISYFDLTQMYSHIIKEFDYLILNFKKIFGLNFFQTDPWSLNRYFFNIIAKVSHDTAGASPGLVGSFLASGFFFPFLIYYLLYVKSVLILVLNNLKLNIFGLGLFSIAFVSPLFLSPISSINFISASGIELFFFILFSFEINKKL